VARLHWPWARRAFFVACADSVFNAFQQNALVRDVLLKKAAVCYAGCLDDRVVENNRRQSGPNCDGRFQRRLQSGSLLTLLDGCCAGSIVIFFPS
jgi:hypothetical protein